MMIAPGETWVDHPAVWLIIVAPPAAQCDAHHAAEQAEHDRLDQELQQDVRASGAERFANADLARPLGDRHEHDVHDADAADEQRHRRDAGEQVGDDLRRLADVVSGSPPDCESGNRPECPDESVLATQHALDLRHRVRDLVFRLRRAR